MDLESLDRWDDYTAAKTAMLRFTDTETAPWYRIKSNDKKRARLNAMRLFLDLHDYEGKDPSVIQPTDPLIVTRGYKNRSAQAADLPTEPDEVDAIDQD